jgi:hypothetical protein
MSHRAVFTFYFLSPQRWKLADSSREVCLNHKTFIDLYESDVYRTLRAAGVQVSADVGVAVRKLLT